MLTIEKQQEILDRRKIWRDRITNFSSATPLDRSSWSLEVGHWDSCYVGHSCHMSNTETYWRGIAFSTLLNSMHKDFQVSNSYDYNEARIRILEVMDLLDKLDPMVIEKVEEVEKLEKEPLEPLELVEV